MSDAGIDELEQKWPITPTSPLLTTLLGGGHGLFRVAGIVLQIEHELLAVDAAGLVDHLGPRPSAPCFICS